MKKSALIFFFLIAGLTNTHAQFLYSNAESAAMGHSVSAMQSPWAVFHNPAGTAQITEWTVGSSINSQISINYPYDMLVYSAFAIAPTKNGSFHFIHNGARFADYNQNGESNLFGIGYAHRFGNKLRLGVHYSYLAANSEGFHPSKSNEQQIKIGGQYDLLEKLTIGLTLNGVKRTVSYPHKYSYPGARPTIGAEYRFNSRWLARADFRGGGVGRGPVSIAGQYRAFDNLFLRAGVVPHTFGLEINGGIGVKHEKYQLDLSVSPYYYYGALINISGAYKF